MCTKCNRNKKIVFDKTVGKLKSREKVPEKDDTLSKLAIRSPSFFDLCHLIRTPY